MFYLDSNNIKELSSHEARNLEFCAVPEQERWRVGFIHELIELSHGEYEIEGFSKEEINDILNFISTSKWE